ncbi:formate-dependent nitrite reductase membrane component NrfD [Sulfitobacter undariae]|uniref:Formate-dependent nitrite reductase membrane component NrfD n=1 Tax=Sulfitobacter undariae TaxID=1563671 RepID=A0A7W6E790_9RHOB|nr:hypothetical protein [Sulfitobacter undariae]MBB3992549.1 formate-dependent nitrite reductase membrane component NrfD [Sulfitobacter undariae]
MDTDLALVMGLVIIAVAIPSLFSAITDRRAPSASIVSMLIGGGLVAFAILTKAGGYTLEGLPDVVVNLIARYMP